MPNDPFIREKFTRERTAAKKLAAEFAFVFRDVRQPLKLVCQNCPTLRNGHERGGAADDLQASQQRAADQLKALQQTVSSDQAEIIRLSEKVTALTGKLQALQQSFANAQRAPAPLQPIEPAKQKRVAR